MPEPSGRGPCGPPTIPLAQPVLRDQGGRKAAAVPVTIYQTRPSILNAWNRGNVLLDRQYEGRSST